MIIYIFTTSAKDIQPELRTYHIQILIFTTKISPTIFFDSK